MFMFIKGVRGFKGVMGIQGNSCEFFWGIHLKNLGSFGVLCRILGLRVYVVGTGN